MRFRQLGFFFLVIVAGFVAGDSAIGSWCEHVLCRSERDGHAKTARSTIRATSFTKAITAAVAGDTIYARGGTYNLHATISIGSSKNGTAANPYQLLAYPGETPVLDFRGEPYNASNSGLKGISLNGSYWHIKGLTIQYAADNGIAIGGSSNTIEQVVSRQNQDSGFQISGSGTPVQ